ncbi:hypothetical protein ACTHPB_27925 [Priestia megaterium]|uniref:hypothetical protein n=1 Tax=Priestia megaterium TaxID=1404 RepID=UPI003F7F64D2
MSVITTLFNTLSGDLDLRALLAAHSLAPDFPAIYDRWATEDIPMPYIVLSYGFEAGDVTSKMDSSVVMDIFTAGNSTIMAENIRDRLREMLDHNIIFSEGEGPIRTHYLRDGNIQEPEDDVVHWMIEFRVIYWDASLINAINQRS